MCFISTAKIKNDMAVSFFLMRRTASFHAGKII